MWMCPRNGSLGIHDWHPEKEDLVPVCDGKGCMMVLNLTTNHLSGFTPPSTTESLTELAIIDTSGNDLKGHVPTVGSAA